MDKQQFREFLTSRGFMADDAGLCWMFYRGSQVIGVIGLLGQPPTFNAGINGEAKLAYEMSPLPDSQLKADLILNSLAHLEQSQAVGKPVEINLKQTTHWSRLKAPVPPEFDDWKPRENPYIHRDWPVCQSFAPRRPRDRGQDLLRKLHEMFETQRARDNDQTRRDKAGKVYRSLKEQVRQLEGKLAAKEYTTRRLDDCKRPYICEVIATYTAKDSKTGKALATADAIKLVDLNDGSPFSQNVLNQRGGPDRLRHHRQLIVELTTLWARLRALQLLERTMKTPTGYHITVDGTPLCADFDKFTTRLRAEASEKYGALPRCGYSEESVADAFADIVRAMVPDADIEVVTSPCPVQLENDEAHRQKRSGE